jgi:hypothetical protein
LINDLQNAISDYKYEPIKSTVVSKTQRTYTYTRDKVIG